MASKSPKLKISFVTSEETNKNIEKSLARIIAESIYAKPEFQSMLETALNPSNV
jgi:hypothetical protein